MIGELLNGISFLQIGSGENKQHLHLLARKKERGAFHRH
jgi:hypothetical protein